MSRLAFMILGILLSGSQPGRSVPDDMASVPARIVKDRQGADVQLGNATYPSQGWDIRRGSRSNPVNGHGATVKISRTEKVEDLASEMAGNRVDNYANAALNVQVDSVPGSLGQPNAIQAGAYGEPNGADVLGISGQGVIGGAATGYAYGGYFEGRSQSPTTGAHGAEVRAKNIRGTRWMTQRVAASRYMGLWATASDGPGNVGVGVGSGDGINGWDIGFQATAGGGFRTAAFVAEGLERGIGHSAGFMVRGSHRAGLDLGGADFTGSAILLPNGSTPANGIRFGLSETIHQDSADGLRIGGSGRIGFGKASVARPKLPAPATDIASAIVLLNAIRAALLANGLAE